MDHLSFHLSAQEDLYADLLWPDLSEAPASKLDRPNMMICVRLRRRETETEFVNAQTYHQCFGPRLKLSGCPQPFAPRHQAILSRLWSHLSPSSSAGGRECCRAMVHAKDFDMGCAPMGEQILQALTANGGGALYEPRTTNLRGSHLS